MRNMTLMSARHLEWGKGGAEKRKSRGKSGKRPRPANELQFAILWQRCWKQKQYNTGKKDVLLKNNIILYIRQNILNKLNSRPNTA